MKKTLVAIALAASSIASMSAMAADSSNFYAGASIGHSRFSDVDGGGAAVDPAGTSGSVYGGYQVTPQVGVEVGYTRYADIKVGAATAKAEAVTAEVVGRMAVAPKVTAFAKGGVAYTQLRGDAHEDKFVPVIGVGAEYALANNLSARADVQYIHDFAGAGANSLTTSVGVNYKF